MVITDLKKGVPALLAAGLAVSAAGAMAESASGATAYFCSKNYSTQEICRLDNGAGSPIYGNTWHTSAGPGTGATGTYCSNAYKYYGGQKKGIDSCGITGSPAAQTFDYTPSDPSNPAVLTFSNPAGQPYKGSYENY